MSQEDDVYEAHIAALCYNLSERLYEAGYETEDGARLDRLIIEAVKYLGYGELDQEKMNRTIIYYVSPDSPIYGTPEYGRLAEHPEYRISPPDIDYKSIE